jgi:hypothetical protein
VVLEREQEQTISIGVRGAALINDVECDPTVAPVGDYHLYGCMQIVFRKGKNLDELQPSDVSVE